MEGKHLHGDEWSHHIRKWKKKQSLAWTSPCFSVEKLHKKQTAQFTNVFSPYAFCLLYIKENQWILSRQFHPPQINWMWICYFSTNETTYRRNSNEKQLGDLTGCCWSRVLWDLLWEAEVKVEIGYLKNSVHRSWIFRGARLSMSGFSFDTSCLKPIKIWKLLLTSQCSLWISDPLGPLVCLMKPLNVRLI